MLGLMLSPESQRGIGLASRLCAALVVSSFFVTSIAEATAYDILMNETDFERLIDRLKNRGWFISSSTSGYSKEGTPA